ncbi:MAG: alpha/beta hydrolase [Syntrophaceae bacterium]|nr:alpha/beta hydrolase [Syntrophaceae bacterium]
MANDKRIETIPGNSPVRDIPADYYPTGCGFWFKIPEGKDAGKKLFYRDSSHGEGKPENTIVFVHGNPESSYIYRKVIKEIITAAKKPFRIIAMDHVGFGLSDQSTYHLECMNHAENLLQLVRYLDLKNVTMVVHDWGGPIGVGAFLKEPERVSNLVLTNTTIFPMPETGITYNTYPVKWIGWSKVPLLMPRIFWGHYSSYAIYRTPANPFMIISQMIIYIAMAVFGIFTGEEKVAKKFFRDQFNSKSNRLSSRRFVRQSGRWGKGNTFPEPSLGQQDTTPFYRFMQDNIKKLWGPVGRNIGVRAVLGRWDPLGKDEVIKQWTDNLPQLQGHVQVFENVGHFIEEAKPREIAEAIIDVAKLK